MAVVKRPERKCSHCEADCRPTPPRTICQLCKLKGVADPGLGTVVGPPVVPEGPNEWDQEPEGKVVVGDRIAAFDIETTSLNATYGRLLCACFKFNDHPEVITVEARRMADERRAIKQIRELWDMADIVATWNGKRFDLPFINALLMYYNLKPLTHQRMHKDLLYEQRKLRFCGARLDNASQDLRVEYSKFHCPSRAWPKAADGDEVAFNQIAYHCKLDVLLTEAMYMRLKPMFLRITK